MNNCNCLAVAGANSVLISKKKKKMMATQFEPLHFACIFYHGTLFEKIPVTKQHQPVSPV
jgi:hypothetical protein